MVFGYRFYTPTSQHKRIHAHTKAHFNASQQTPSGDSVSVCASGRVEQNIGEYQNTCTATTITNK